MKASFETKIVWKVTLKGSPIITFATSEKDKESTWYLLLSKNILDGVGSDVFEHFNFEAGCWK